MLPGQFGFGVRKRHIAKHAATCGIKLRVGQNARFLGTRSLFIGDYVEVGPDVFIEASGTIRLGNKVSVGPGTKIWSNNHRYENPDIPILDQGLEYAEVVIEDDVWIGANCIIKPGIRISKGCVISAGTVLSKSVPGFAIVAGNPGRVVGWRKVPERGGARPADSGADSG